MKQTSHNPLTELLVIIREALFFLITNVMVVFGLVTVDHAVAIAEYDTVMSKPADSRQPSLARIFWSYMTSQSRSLDIRFLEGLNAAIEKLSQKSQSMYLGSAMFQDRLRIDLVLLYETKSSQWKVISD